MGIIKHSFKLKATFCLQLTFEQKYTSCWLSSMELNNCGHTIKRPTYSILFGKFLVGMGTNFGVPVRNNRKTDNQWTNLLYLWLKEKKSWYQTEKYNLDTAKLKESASGVLEFWTSDVFCLWLLLLLPVRPFNTMGLFHFLKLNTYFQKKQNTKSFCSSKSN